ncbi:MAG: NAD(P)-dependent oxidoreductase [Gammaproteobacteria bacterium]|nr:NAD(P)-dependent oxidoreductase [Gammaproteobacteria bacterium]
MILITGASGFVGSQVLRHMRNNIDSKFIRVVLRESSEETSLYKNCDIFRTSDLFHESQERLSIMLQDVELVIHCAWYAEPGLYLDSEKNLDCLEGTISLARASISQGVKRFVGIGTCYEYNISNEKLSIGTRLNPTSLYGACKASAFIIMQEMFRLHALEFVWCRLFYLYGEGEDKRRLVPYIKSMLEQSNDVELTSGNQIRDYLDVVDAAKMIFDISNSAYTGAYNVCSEKPVSVREIAEKIADEYDRRDLLKFGSRTDNPLEPKFVVGVKTSI